MFGPVKPGPYIYVTIKKTNMKIITEKHSTETIHISEVNAKYHIVVAILSGKPTILGKGYNEPNKALSFLLLGGGNYDQTITTGNGYNYSDEDNNVEKMILKAIDRGNKVEVFRKQDWKNALQWLMDNA